MKCLLCLQTTNSVFNIFEGLKEGFVILDIPNIIDKYIHFKTNEGNSMLCEKCWNTIESFHIFCLQIEEAHKNYREINKSIFNYKTEIDIENVKNEHALLDSKDSVNTDNDAGSVEIIKIENSEDNTDLSLPGCTTTNYKTEENFPNQYALYKSTKNKNLKIKIKKLKSSYSVDNKCNDIQSINNFKMSSGLSEKIKTDNCQRNKNETKLISGIKHKKEFGFDANFKTKIGENKKNGNNIKQKIVVLEQNADAADEKIAKFMTLSCQICNEILPTLATLKSHYRVIHQQKGYVICCNKKFFKRILLVDHIECHLNPAHFKCSLCDKTFSRSDSLKKHMKRIHESHETDREVCYCDQCPKKFIDKKNLARHKSYHSPLESWKFPCGNCSKIFPNKFYLLLHNRFSHKATATKMCDVCGKVVSAKRYQSHMQRHDSNYKAVKIKCHICNSFLSKRYMRTHLKNHEDANQDHICPTCGKKSPNRTALNKHIYEAHRLKKTHHCTVCNKAFKTKDLLLQHIPVHTGENNFECTVCNRLFKFNSNLHEHKKKEHPIEYEQERENRKKKYLENCITIENN